MGFTLPVQPVVIIIAIVLVGLFMTSFYRQIMRELKEVRKALSEIERRLDVVRRYRDEKDQGQRG
jgi:uncharacterized protein YoxC